VRGFGCRVVPAQKSAQSLITLRQKRHSQPAAARNRHLSSGIMVDFGDNVINGIVAFRAQDWRADAGYSIGSAPCRR
jgi:hypothetical protein